MWWIASWPWQVGLISLVALLQILSLCFIIHWLVSWWVVLTLISFFSNSISPCCHPRSTETLSLCWPRPNHWWALANIFFSFCVRCCMFFFCCNDFKCGCFPSENNNVGVFPLLKNKILIYLCVSLDFMFNGKLGEGMWTFYTNLPLIDSSFHYTKNHNQERWTRTVYSRL